MQNEVVPKYFTSSETRPFGIATSQVATVICFWLRLPFTLPIPDGRVFNIFLPNHDDDGAERNPDVRLELIQITVSPQDAAERPYAAGADRLFAGKRRRPGEGPVGQTWVEASTEDIVWRDEHLEALGGEHGVQQLWLERCLAGLNYLLRGYLIAVEVDAEVHPVNREALDPAILYNAWVPSEEYWSYDLPQLLALHGRATMRPEGELSDERCDAIAEIVRWELTSAAARYPHPFLVLRHLLDRAYKNRFAGDDAAAVQTLQTAAETFLRAVYRMALVDSGELATTIDEEVTECPFASLASRLQHLIGGSASDWSKTGDGSFGRYWQRLYGVRCRITHQAREPKPHEVPRAFDAYDDLRDFLTATLLRRHAKWPRTLLSLLGRRDFLEADGTGHRRNDVVAGLLAEPAPWWLPHDAAGR